MNIIDLTHPLNPNHISIYPGDPCFTCTPHATVDNEGYAVHAISMGTHTGTHLDAPAHFISNGMTVDKVPLTNLVGTVFIVDLSAKGPRGKITWKDLEMYKAKIGTSKIVFLRTDWSRFWGTSEYMNHPYLTREAAEKLVALNVEVVGIDCYSPDETGGKNNDFGAHEVILGSGAVIVENLTNLEMLDESYNVSIMPLSLYKCDGSPVRAYAWKE